MEKSKSFKPRIDEIEDWTEEEAEEILENAREFVEAVDKLIKIDKNGMKNKTDKNIWDEQIVAKIKEIQNIPYEIGHLYEGEELIKYGKGGCGPKHRYLARFLINHGYEVKICVGKYQWKNLKNIPAELKNHPKAEYTGNHVFLKIKNKNKWLLIDISLDNKLSPILPANVNWDGKSNQQMAIPCKEIQCFNYPEPYLSWRQKNINQPKISSIDKDFADKLNKWLEKIRSK